MSFVSDQAVMMNVALVFPHQLFRQSLLFEQSIDRFILIEDDLFFGDTQYPLRFHGQKLAYHRASLSHYRQWLCQRAETDLIRYQSGDPALDRAFAALPEEDMTLWVLAVHDFVLERRLKTLAETHGIPLRILDTPAFLNQTRDNQEWREDQKRWFMKDFYRWQRQRLDVLIESDGDPAGGQWSFDEDNRRKLPSKALPQLPELPQVNQTQVEEQAVHSVQSSFEDAPGTLEKILYPTDFEGADRWLDDFLAQRLAQFGPYEDAMEPGQNWLYHSVLTPMLNIGLLTPEIVLTRTLEHVAEHEVPLASVEGFIRQIIGWREFMHATYEDLGVRMRTSNHWQHQRRMPACFYTGSTGIDPVDDVIGRVLDTGYCHHIERLMVLGSVMFLCEIRPDDIYAWFMELFIDSYDWVMVPNVYAMSQHADGGLITTKPYFCGSNYIRKMSHYPTGPWCEIWDALFWRWIIEHQEELSANPRWSMMCAQARRMSDEKRQDHLDRAAAYLDRLDTRD